MLKKNIKKLLALLSVVAMLATTAPMAGATALNAPVKLGEGDYVTISQLDTVGDADGVITTSEKTIELKGLTAANNFAIGSFMTFEMTINAATKDTGDAKGDFNGLSFLLNPTKSSKTGPSLTFYYSLTDATDFTKGTATVKWKGSSAPYDLPTESGKSIEIGKKYKYTFEYVASNSLSLTVTDEDGAVVLKATGLPTRTASEADDTLAGVTLNMEPREAGKESGITISDMIVYTGIGPDDITVTANDVETEAGEGQNVVLGGGDKIIVSSVGGDIDLSGVVNKDGAAVSNYTVSYALKDAVKGVEVDGNTLKVTALADSGTINATLLAYPVDSKGNVITSSYASIPVVFEKENTPIADYADYYANNTLKLLDQDGNEITPSAKDVYTFTDGFTPVAGDGARVNVEWICYQQNRSGEWVESKIINTNTGKYNVEAGKGYTGNIKLTAVVTSDEDSSLKLTTDFICSVSNPSEEVQNDYDSLSIDSEVSSNITLPTTGDYGSTILWTSSNPDVISKTGKVTRGTKNQTVTLTAMIEKGNTTLEKTFEVTVLKKISSSSSGSGGISGTSSKVSGIGVVSTVSPTPVPTAAPVVTEDNAAPVFTDLDSVDWAKEAITELANRKVVNGKTDTTFAPNDDITRAEFAKILINAFGLVNPNAVVTDLSDVKDSSAWYYESIASAYAKGIITGYADGSFGINDKVTRQDMAVMVYRAAQAANLSINVWKPEANFADADQIGDYAKEAVDALQRAGVINGLSDTEFAPKATATRAQAAKIIYGLAK